MSVAADNDTLQVIMDDDREEICNRETSENKETMDSAVGDVNIKYQKELIYNKLLPYVDDLEAESQALLAVIKANLGRAVMLREMQPGCVVWVSRLCLYIKIYGMKFSKEDHIIFVKLMYELVTIPKLEPYLVSTFSFTLILLLEKKGLISPNEMELPWKPLYNLCRRIEKSRESSLEMYRFFSCAIGRLNVLVHAVKVYFPLSATQEILDELRPNLCPLDDAMMTKSLEALEWFLPVQLPPEHRSIGYELWFNEFMTLWEVCYNAPEWENEMMCLIAQLAFHNIGYIDWEPYIPLMFTRFVRYLKLPVTYSQTQSSKDHKINMSFIAIWTTSVLGNGSSAQMYLEKFLKTVETYFHPANVGRWLGKLRDLLITLPYRFVTRLHKERFAKRTWETPIPEEYKLTDSDVDAFVKSMMPVAMTAMFSTLGVRTASQALQHLASMRPSLVIPSVLDKVSSMLEPYKLNATLSCMEAIARPMAQGSRNVNEGYTYPEGPTHILPLLFVLLPSIDPNDMEKCFVAFRLISVYATFIPIVDSSESLTAVDDEERMVYETTSKFKDFILEFLDRIFSFIDSSSLETVRLENRAGAGKSKLEKVTEGVLREVCTNLLIQTNDKIFKAALHKLRTFITERILETKVAGQLAAVLCRSFAQVNGEKTLRALLPVLSQTILDITGESNDIIKEENLDGRLLYGMLLLSAIVDTSGDNLLPHMDTFTTVLDRVLVLKSREGNNLACIVLKTIIFSLATTMPCKFESTNNDVHWGKTLEIDTLKVKWYIPGKEEIAALNKLFLKYLMPEVNRLQDYCKDWNTLTREELLTSLHIVSCILHACEPVLPIWEEEPLVVVDSSLDCVPFTLMLGMKEEILMPDNSNVRRYFVTLMSKLQKVILENSEDDTKSFFVLIQIWNSLLLGRNRLSEAHEARCKSFQIVSKRTKDKLVGNKGLRGSLILQRAEIQHDTRIHVQSFNLTETHKIIMFELLTLATSRYADVRSQAQSSLFCALQHFPYSYTFIVPRLVDVLKLDAEEHHDAYKGALYILFGPPDDPIIIKHDWKMLRSLWLAIVLSKTSEKLSVIRLKENLVESINTRFATFAITMEVPDACLAIATNLWTTYPQPTLPQPAKDEIANGLDTLRKIEESNVTSYNDLIGDLLSALLENNLHWRHRLMTMNFIRNLVHPDQKYPAKLVRYFLGALIHDSLRERKIAIDVVVYMLKQQKRKHPKITIDPPTLPEKEEPDENRPKRLVPGQRPDNLWLQYNYETRPLTAEQWDEPRYIHKPYIGYYTWPKKLEIYAPSSSQPCLDPTVRKLTDLEEEVDHFFSDPQNIEKLVRFFSLEEKKGKDNFNDYRYFLFKSVFRNHGIVYLKHFLPHLHKMVTDKQESSHRCAAEIIAGVIKGAKHWPFEMVREMWDSLLPIIRLALSNLTAESFVNWCACFATAQQHRDPNRQHWLLECLMEEPRLGDSESSFVECGRLVTLQVALNEQTWRVSELLQRLLKRTEDRLLTNPFDNVRERLGSVLVTVFKADLQFPGAASNAPTPRMQDLINNVVPKLQFLVEESPTILGKDEEALSANESSRDAKRRAENREMAIRLLKTICKWMTRTVVRTQHGLQRGFYQIYPILCQLENCETDEELRKLCTSTLAVLAQAFTLPRHMPIALEAVINMSKRSSWWTRSTCLQFLQVLVFHNMSTFLSNPAWVDSVKDMVLRLLEDERLEVRKNAGQVLSGLLHCTFIPEQEKLLDEFKKKAKTKLRWRERSNCSKEETIKNSQMDAIRIRHAAVLGMCAFVQAHPYDIPEYIPSIFENLSPHMNDPQPIPTTIRKTLDDFKRTHYGGWRGVSGYAQHFTSEQLAVLQDLSMPPSHYA